jgi:hypothetical protein
MKTSELTGAALDWAVAQCTGFPVRNGFDDNCPEYSTRWEECGPIIEREWIELVNGSNIAPERWGAIKYSAYGEPFVQNGPTPLIAAMRCYVASKLGDTVEIPDEFITG